MRNFDSVPDNVPGYVEFREKSGNWTPALGDISGGPKIFRNKDEALGALLISLARIATLTLTGMRVRIPAPEEFRFYPTEVPKAFDAEPADMMAASDVLKAALAKAKGGAA